MSPSSAYVFATDTAFVTPLGVALSRLSMVTEEANIVVLHDGLQPADRRWLVETAGSDLRVDFKKVDEKLVDRVAPPAHLPRATLFRLLMGELLPTELRRVAYLDIDLLIRHDPAPLLDASSHGVAAVRDMYRPWIGGRPAIPWREFGLNPDAPYLNAGVLAIDLDWWREQRVGERCLSILQAHALPWADQDALNVVLHGNWTELDPSWNVQTDLFRDHALGWVAGDLDQLTAAKADPMIVHFTGPDKPWRGATTPFSDEWRRALARTSRPRWSDRVHRNRWLSRVRRRIGRAVAGSAD